MTTLDKLKIICSKKLTERNITDHTVRLNLELDEIKKQDEADYILGLYESNVSGMSNENNLLVYYLLGVCDTVDLNREPAYTEPQWPDIDVDYLPELQQHLKEKYAPETFGKDHVCNISNYSTFGIKSSLIDMARIFGLNHYEVLSLTKKLPMKDEEGDALTWDSAIKICPELKEYLLEHTELADAARHLSYADIDWDKFGYPNNPPRRNRNLGQHASGLVISSVPLSENLPLVRGKGGLPTSAWPEGLASTDLSSVGYVKFDFLALEANNKVAQCNRLVMERTGRDSICALPERENWSDVSYLNAPKSLEMANNGDLKGVFQFDSDGIRNLVKKGGVTCWDDLAAYSALFRPGPMDMNMHTAYCDRKQGKETYSIHPLLEPILGHTYNVMVYQEQIMSIINKVGLIPIQYAQDIIKAISKKKVDKFQKFKEEFIKNAQKTLEIEEAEAGNLWSQIEAFAGYGFNLAHTACYTVISARQLYHKAHYPKEFFTTALQSLSTGDERIREYVSDARQHGIEVKPLSLNESGYDFEIIDDGIYYGFSKVKGIGEKSAKRIIDRRENGYKDLQDFMERFGTEAKVLQPLIALGCFSGRDKLTLYKYYEHYKDCAKKKQDRKKRHQKSLAGYQEKLNALVGRHCELSDASVLPLQFQLDDATWKLVKRLYSNYQRSIKRQAIPSNKYEIVSLDGFTDSDFYVTKELTTMLTEESGAKAEELYYGFVWKHPLENIPDADEDGTFEKFDGSADDDYPVDLVIKKVYEKKSRNDKVYYSVLAEDRNCKSKYISVWKDDYEKFKGILNPGQMVRMRLKKPNKGFANPSLLSLTWEQRISPPENDNRVFSLQEKQHVQ
jgi:DNA polymerase-3 subunit alpha